MKQIKKQHFLDVQSFKMNGNLYRQWNGVKIFFEDDDLVGIVLNKTKVSEPTTKWSIVEPVFWFFSKKYFFNIQVTPKKAGMFYYINLASPFFIEDDTIKYIDFDFDLKIYPNKMFSVVDQKDFERNKSQYDKKTISVIHENIAIVTELIYKKWKMFDNEFLIKLIKDLINKNEIKSKHFKFLFDNK